MKESEMESKEMFPSLPPPQNEFQKSIRRAFLPSEKEKVKQQMLNEMNPVTPEARDMTFHVLCRPEPMAETLKEQNQRERHQRSPRRVRKTSQELKFEKLLAQAGCFKLPECPPDDGINMYPSEETVSTRPCIDFGKEFAELYSKDKNPVLPHKPKMNLSTQEHYNSEKLEAYSYKTKRNTFSLASYVVDKPDSPVQASVRPKHKPKQKEPQFSQTYQGACSQSFDYENVVDQNETSFELGGNVKSVWTKLRSDKRKHDAFTKR